MTTLERLPAETEAGVNPAATPAIASLERLADVLGRENAALKTRDTGAVRRLVEEKRRHWSPASGWLASDRRDGDGDGEVMADDAFAELKARLAGLSAENQRRLHVAILANRRLVETIAVAAQSREAGDTYATDGRAEAASGRKGPAPRALSVDRAL